MGHLDRPGPPPAGRLGRRDRRRGAFVAGHRGRRRSARSTGIAATIDGRRRGRRRADGPGRRSATSSSTSPARRSRRPAINPFQGFLHLLADPNIAFILFTIGFYGLLFELQNPNFVTGILGALAIVLAFVGFGSLPLNLAGLLLIGIGILLFALEPTVTSHGLLTIGGVVCFVLGASALYTQAGPVRAGRPRRLAAPRRR